MTPSLQLLATASLIAGFLGAPAQSHPSTPGAGVAERAAADSLAEQRRVLRYWTPRRMAAAIPLGLAAPLGRMPVLAGVLGATAGAPARPAAQVMPAMQTTQVTPQRGRQRQATRPRTSTNGTRWTSGGAVTRTTGRVFLTMNGNDFVCSASTVRGTSKDVVVTAGHCVKDGTGSWAANWTFVPGYRDDRRPYGTYTARRMFVAAPWHRAGDDDHDLGMVALNTWGGKHVADVVGTQAIAFAGARGGQAFGFGFPADPPYDGRELVYCAGPLREDPNRMTTDQGLACNMTAGASGGPWLTGFNLTTGRGVITSVSSFKYNDDRRTMYGPYFGDSAKQLYAAAQAA
jgi:V8-like Glu-specific endopeptidase